MKEQEILSLLEQVKAGNASVAEAFAQLKDLSYAELGYAKIDYHRQLRNGYPEVIYCQGKAPEHVRGIVKSMLEHNIGIILATRVSPEVAAVIQSLAADAEYYPIPGICIIRRQEMKKQAGVVAVCTGGTADIKVAEEAALTCELYGNPVERVYDVGVAGLHRLLDKLDIIRRANVIIAVAGMEGALASVIGGLSDKPVIAVPTSIGYGANFGGVSALLSMLNSCASGISVVNIDNGFGAGYLASMINKMNVPE
ncbi:nickel pincer cofactor biosynthesis protein LarB [Clostridiales bacterium COT073_COT-073]|nr:nickel pincer cofactor biosynthesis protein LarB [Clostridiales bacterium COT073_COT-073]